MIVINNFHIVGEVRRVQVNESKSNKGSTALILVQYGEDRDRTNGQVEFVNAALIRVPHYRYSKIADKLKEGAYVSVQGHIQGALRPVMGGDGYFTSELVADRVTFDNGDEGEE